MNDTNGYGAPPPGPPPVPPSAPPPPPSAPPSGGTGDALVLRVSRRMLWAGSAAFPLHNITMVDAFMFRPSRLAALVRCLKWLFGALLVYLAYVALNAMDHPGGGGADNPALLVVLCVAALVVPVKDLFAPPKPVLSVQVASGTALVVTLPSLGELQQIAGRIAYAIDNPEAEFTAVVHQYNTNNYGPVANVNGGQGNTGFKL